MDGIVRQNLRIVEEDFSSPEEKICPEPPDEISFDAKCIWLECAGDLFEKGVLVGIGLELFRNFCIVSGEARECERMISVDGKICGGKKHPAFDMMIKAIDLSKNIYAILSPKKTGPKEDEEESDWKKDKGLLA